MHAELIAHEVQSSLNACIPAVTRTTALMTSTSLPLPVIVAQDVPAVAQVVGVTRRRWLCRCHRTFAASCRIRNRVCQRSRP